ncbi:conserved hypothetical protein, partial [Ricinus communis]
MAPATNCWPPNVNASCAKTGRWCWNASAASGWTWRRCCNRPPGVRHERADHRRQPAQAVRQAGRAGWRQLHRGARPHRRPDRPQRLRQDHYAQGHPRPDALPGRVVGAGHGPAHAARGADERSVLHRRCGHPAALAQGQGRDRLRRRRASALQPRQGGKIPRQHQADAGHEGQGHVQGHGGAAAPGAGDGDRRQAAGAGRADAGPGHPVPQAVLPEPAGRLLRREQDHPHHHPPDRGGRAHPDRPA